MTEYNTILGGLIAEIKEDIKLVQESQMAIMKLLEQLKDRLMVKEYVEGEKGSLARADMSGKASPSEMVLATDSRPAETPKEKIIKKVKGSKKIELGKVYDFRRKDGKELICDKCDGLISWDDYPNPKHPIHVDKNGHIIGDGSCPEWEAK